jgi:hypothetical protein
VRLLVDLEVDEDFFAGDFLAEDFFAVVDLLVFDPLASFLAAVFLVDEDLLVASFLAAVDLLDDDLLADDLLAVDLLGDFFAVDDLLADDLLADFFADDDLLVVPVAARATAAPVDAAADAACRAGAVAAFATSLTFGSFLAPETTALRSAPAVNFGMAVFFALMRSPVRGLRTHRASRTRFSNDPKPVIATFSPRATSRVMTSSTDSSACCACLRFPS